MMPWHGAAGVEEAEVAVAVSAAGVEEAEVAVAVSEVAVADSEVAVAVSVEEAAGVCRHIVLHRGMPVARHNRSEFKGPLAVSYRLNARRLPGIPVWPLAVPADLADPEE